MLVVGPFKVRCFNAANVERQTQMMPVEISAALFNCSVSEHQYRYD